MAALPFIFLTNDLHAISPTTLQSSHHPQSVQITKHFSLEHVEDIKREFEKVKKLGSATAEEWIKGLDDLGKGRRNDAARWERWESGGGLVKMRELGSHHTPKPAALIRNSLPAKMEFPAAAHVESPALQTPKPTPQPLQATHAPPMPVSTQSNYCKCLILCPDRYSGGLARQGHILILQWQTHLLDSIRRRRMGLPIIPHVHTPNRNMREQKKKLQNSRPLVEQKLSDVAYFSIPL